ncbi:hypothetical protein KIPB_007256, partial [Kipferlia bialata]|eukprot:g7256.t1
MGVIKVEVEGSRPFRFTVEKDSEMHTLIEECFAKSDLSPVAVYYSVLVGMPPRPLKLVYNNTRIESVIKPNSRIRVAA